MHKDERDFGALGNDHADSLALQSSLQATTSNIMIINNKRDRNTLDNFNTGFSTCENER